MTFRSQARSEEGTIGLWIDDVAQASRVDHERLRAAFCIGVLPWVAVDLGHAVR